MSSHIDVVAIDRANRGAAVDAMVEALLDDPGWIHVLPDRSGRRAALTTLLTSSVREGASDGRVALMDGTVVGAACWPAPGTYPPPLMARLRGIPAMLRLALALRGDMRTLGEFGSAIDAAFPTDPVRYLQVIGVHPGHQRRGVGRALMEEGLARADDNGETVYLETSKPENVGFYQRYGFEVMAGSPAPIGSNGPTMWRMQRPRR